MPPPSPPAFDVERQGADESRPLLRSNGDGIGSGTSPVGAEPTHREHSGGFLHNVLEKSKIVLLSNWANVLLPLVPVGIVAGVLNWNPTAVFVLNFLAIMPLAALLSFATEELALEVGETLGGLLNATFGI
jgi:Ca2+:H+ antiporter